ncbi:MAG: hypothetical protein KDC53_04850 [Saprospiraceae bacterium]|nr:hypothetical protein [Saprospiraceae bacterium]
MKILYAIQATGNGHLARAREIIPALSHKAEVDVLISGTQGDLALPYPVSFRKHGLSFVFGNKGQIDLKASLQSFRPVRLWKDIKTCPVENYDLVIHDFDPVTAHACYRKKIRNISLSHQAAFHYSETPRPKKKNIAGEWILQHFAPSNSHIGLHFRAYHPSIFTPIIRQEIRRLKSERQDHIVVYLPAYDHHYLCSIFREIPNIQWKIFSKHYRHKESHSNIEIFPVDTKNWLEQLRTCEAAIVGAGFEGPSEVMFLGKKLLVVPMKNQYEQQCNAIALKDLGIKTLNTINPKKIPEIKDWIRNSSENIFTFPDHTHQIISKILGVGN